ncbi:hypothetical protein E2562_039383 [Oryza meyeriana var. granulata]|uniref:VQ domain-containing protein n=1 Tax=Oryza meyeriana var. granulata TaxID=110450 RepID=A0A6G1CBS2_9ORYZ|nr:hypothetical protein E2562_039383 [Oryza meyeriana var. granulata]
MERRQSQPALPAPAAMNTKVYVADQSTFKELVQRLTGQQPAEAVAQQVAAGTSAARRGRGRLAVRRMGTAIQKPAHQLHHLSPKLSVVSPARPRLAGFASPSPWGPDGPCVLNKQVELPPSPPSASTLAEEIDETAEEKTTQEGKLEDMHQSPPVRNRREPKLLNLFPLTSSYSKNCRENSR